MQKIEDLTRIVVIATHDGIIEDPSLDYQEFKIGENALTHDEAVEEATKWFQDFLENVVDVVPGDDRVEELESEFEIFLNDESAELFTADGFDMRGSKIGFNILIETDICKL